MKKLKIAILGSGNIGTDLLIKVLRSPYLECGIFAGRNLNSQGMQTAKALGVNVSDQGIEYILQHPDCCSLVFDATSSAAHFEHAPVLAKLGKFVIDLTPAQIGNMCVPVVNMAAVLNQNNINMVTCGGQAAIPVAHALALSHSQIEYIEVISSIASQSAGPATRLNLDEYIHTTEFALKHFSGAAAAKAILNLNPATPCINMQTTIYAKVSKPAIEELKIALQDIVPRVQKYVPGYAMIVAPMVENNRIVIMIRVQGLGDYLPQYAGNLDIINCAAIVIAEKYALTQAELQNRISANEVNIN